MNDYGTGPVRDRDFGWPVGLLRLPLTSIGV